ncbi:hypothetical protein [Pontixanthobacter sp.]|uniref:hypothetical protein n=1 Tax=Pontixanthobacter sp. TaxID=2792078 RepID=UPI003C7BCB20
MRKLRVIALLPVLALACCAPAPDPGSVPQPVTRTAPAPSVVQEPVYNNFLDAPQTPGTWTYNEGDDFSYALFAPAGQPARFGIECMKPSREVRLVRGTAGTGPTPMRIRTETLQRLITATPAADGRPMVIATLPASDNLLDAMALSRGRFAVETGGVETLYLPAWAEVTRVIEDCR